MVPGGDGGEFDSPRGGTQRQTVSSKRIPFDNKDKISVATWEKCEVEAWHSGKNLQQIKRARARTREPLKKTARERTQAPSHPGEPPGELCDEEGMLMVKHTPKKEKRWWERWRDEGGEKKGKCRKEPQEEANKGRTGRSEEGK